MHSQGDHVACEPHAVIASLVCTRSLLVPGHPAGHDYSSTVATGSSVGSYMLPQPQCAPGGRRARTFGSVVLPAITLWRIILVLQTVH